LEHLECIRNAVAFFSIRSSLLQGSLVRPDQLLAADNMLNVQAHASDLSVRAQAFSPMYEYHSPPAAPPPPPPPSAFAPRMPPLPDGAPHFEGWLKHAATVALANPLGSSGTALGTAVA